MIYPRATDLLDNIEATMVSHIEPSLSTLAGKSAAATIRHLLRHVRTRIEVEGQVLTADIGLLKDLLARVQGYFSANPLEQAAGALGAIEAAMANEAAAASGGDYLGLNELAELAGGMREAAYQSLQALVSVAPERAEQPAYLAIRQAMREYLVEQVEAEDRLIAPAFFGGGPRR